MKPFLPVVLNDSRKEIFLRKDIFPDVCELSSGVKEAKLNHLEASCS
jgi:hypothetical protein